MGTPHYAKEILQALIDDELIEVPLVLSQPDRKAGRKGELKAPEVKVLAQEYGLQVLQPEKLSDEGVYESIVKVNPDYIVVAAFGQMLPKKILEIAPCINLHASLLPLYRGASPVQQSLLNGDEFTGITAMLMEEGLDSGPILAYRYFKIPKNMLLSELMSRLSSDAAILIKEVIHRFETLLPIEQNQAVATYCKKIKKVDGLVDFTLASDLYDKYRAFEGWPGIFLKGGIKIKNVTLLESVTKNEMGEILALKEESIVVGCAKGSLEIGILQPASKRAISAKSYCIGRGLKVGNYLL